MHSCCAQNKYGSRIFIYKMAIWAIRIIARFALFEVMWSSSAALVAVVIFPAQLHFIRHNYRQNMQGSFVFIAFMALILSVVAFLPARINVQSASTTQLQAFATKKKGMKNWRALGAARKKMDNAKDKERWEASKVKWEEVKKSS